MRRIALGIALTLLAAASLSAQTPTHVTATVHDSSGIPYSFATVSAQLVPTGTNPTINGAQISATARTQATINGVIGFDLWPTNQITPSGSMWQITVCESPGILPPLGTGSQCFMLTTTITGAAQDLSTAMNAIAPALTNITFGSGTVTGTGTAGDCAQWVTTTAIGAAAAPCGGAPGAPNLSYQYNNGGVFGGVGIGAVTLTNGLSSSDCGGTLSACFQLFVGLAGQGGLPYTEVRHIANGPSLDSYTSRLSEETNTNTNVAQILDAWDGTNYSNIVIDSFLGLVSSTAVTPRLTVYSSILGGIVCPVNSICEHAPAGGVPVTSYELVKPPVAAQGTMIQRKEIPGNVVVTQSFSGDADHSTSVTIGSGTSIGSTPLCTNGFCLPDTTVRVNAYLDITTPCGTSGTYTVNLIYTDDQGTKTVPMNLSGTGAIPATGLVTTTSTANFGQASQIVRVHDNNGINYSTTAAACGTGGPMVGHLYLSAEPLQ